MRAAILFDGKLSVMDVPEPVPAEEQALVRMTAAGVCHSDIHLIKGDWPGMVPPIPIPMGHEGIGIVEELGPGAEKFIQKGDRVILGLGGTGGGYWCGACEYCLSGRPRLCKLSRPIIGTYAEYISVFAKSLVKLPDEVSDREVSLACGGLTAYGAVKKLLKFDITPGKPVAIVGAAGGLGHYAIQVAKAFGYHVVGIDVGQEKLEFVKSQGADDAVDASDAVKVISDKYDGVYASIVFTPKIAGSQLGLNIMKHGGIFISVGIPAASEGPISITPLELFSKDPLIMASIVGNVDDMRELVQLAASGKVKTHVSRVASLSEINQVLEELEAAKYTGRAIINNLAQ